MDCACNFANFFACLVFRDFLGKLEVPKRGFPEMFEGQISWNLCGSSPQASIGDLHVLEARHCITAMLEALKLLKECVYPFLLIHRSISLKSVQKELHGLNIHMRTGTLLRSILFRVISCHLICDGAKQVVSKVAAKMPPYLETWARNTPSFLDCWSPCWSRMQRQSMQPNASNTSATYESESWPTSASFLVSMTLKGNFFASAFWSCFFRATFLRWQSKLAVKSGHKPFIFLKNR